MSTMFENSMAIDSVRTQSHSQSNQYAVPVENRHTGLQDRGFDVRLARPEEYDEVFSLRYDVFLAGHTSQSTTMKDEDIFDSVGDHLIVKHESRIVATYRILPMDRVLAAGLSPYASTEFEISPLLERLEPVRTIELGRSCVHPAYRHGAIPKMLWSALAKYMTQNSRTEAVGCVSVFNSTNAEALALREYFKTLGSWSSEMDCPVLRPCVGDQEEFEQSHLKSLVPPLLKSYLMLGAKLLGGPAHDSEFQCHDFLMHFSTATMSERCRRALFS
jgi:putative hemolysin